MNSSVRVYFAADSHGSEQVWRKWLRAPEFYGAQILILSGDLTGKSIIPLVEQVDGCYKGKVYGREVVAHSATELAEVRERIMFSGHYPYECSREEAIELRDNPRKLDELFERLMADGIRRWLKLAEEKIPKEVKIFVMPGNDDTFVIDEIIKSSDRVIYPLGKVVPFCLDYEMISMDYVNPTPWNSPRECSEKELAKKLDELAKTVAKDWKKVVCNFHAPPFGTRLDLAPKLDEKLVPVTVMGEPVKEHVGSKSVTEFLQKYQPLVGLHGHIHESYASDRIGNTLVVNPGSEYMEGILRGFILDFGLDGIERWYKVEG